MKGVKMAIAAELGGATANDVAFGGLAPLRERPEITAADRIAQNSLLTELPGAAFAFLTLAYVILSLASL
ncbi:MAG TPA: hypothetical protein VMU16_03105 [Candidatus Binataceae bacterium]|nr:hypothetical protein [Candidatus Binataceae bacterium]